jgi:hypothetical protein
MTYYWAKAQPAKSVHFVPDLKVGAIENQRHQSFRIQFQSLGTLSDIHFSFNFTGIV